MPLWTRPAAALHHRPCVVRTICSGMAPPSAAGLLWDVDWVPSGMCTFGTRYRAWGATGVPFGAVGRQRQTMSLLQSCLSREFDG